MATLSLAVFRAVRRIQIRTRRLVETQLLGAYRSAFKGRGVEFEEVREFQPGDDTRYIDWNVTARMHAPFVKNFREERELTVMLLVDISASTQFGSNGRSKSDIIAEIGALIAFSAIANNDKIGLLLFSGDVEKYIPPTKGQKHALRVVRELLTAKAHQKGTDLNQALTFLSRLQRKPAVCFVISDFLTGDLANSLKVAAKRYDCIAVRVLDQRELTLPKLALMRLRDLESGLELLVDGTNRSLNNAFRTRGEKLLQQQAQVFERLGIGLIDVRTDTPYEQAMRRYFYSRKRKR